MQYLNKYFDKYGFPSVVRSNAKGINIKSTGQGVQGAGIINHWAARLN